MGSHQIQTSFFRIHRSCESHHPNFCASRYDCSCFTKIPIYNVCVKIHSICAQFSASSKPSLSIRARIQQIGSTYISSMIHFASRVEPIKVSHMENLLLSYRGLTLFSFLDSYMVVTCQDEKLPQNSPTEFVPVHRDY